MITIDGIVTFNLQNVFPVTVKYTATFDRGEMIEVIDEIVDSWVDIEKHDLEYHYWNQVNAAVEEDVRRKFQTEL